MSCENLRTSELDREIDRELDSPDSSIPFDDDSDADPIYNSIPLPSTSGTFVLNRGRSNTNNLLDSSDSDDYLRRPPKKAKEQQQAKPSRLSQTRPFNRQVMSDSSDDNLENGNSSDDDGNIGQNIDNWDSITENHGFNFVHRSSPLIYLLEWS
ncbi:hypothetical protein J6590_024079 [Homalodisca vitripennis]|nr:hypothetical protein J6590_024079 [Homalodisca vitripennis]